MASNVSQLSVSSMLQLSANGCSSNGFASAFLPLASYKPHISATYHYIKNKNIKPTAITTKCIFDRQTVQTHLSHSSFLACLKWLARCLLFAFVLRTNRMRSLPTFITFIKEDFWGVFSQLLWSSAFFWHWDFFWEHCEHSRK